MKQYITLLFLCVIILFYYASYANAEENLLKEAYKLMQEKDWQRAEANFVQHLSNHPEDIRAKNDLSYVYYNLGKYQEALNLLNEILKVSGDEVLAIFRRGLVSFKLGDYNSGLSDFQRVNTLSPQFGDGWTEFNIGIACYKLEKWDMAIGYFQKAYRRNQKEFENNIYYYRNIGYAFFKTGRYNEAVEVYKQGLMRFPEDEWLFENIGWSLQKSGKKEESVKYLIKASEIGYKKLGSLQSVSVLLPFKGWWKVTHGNDEGWTHRGLGGRYSYDFVAVDEKGAYYSGDGSRNENHYCFGRDILSPVNGIVERIENNIPDNKIGGDIYMPEWWGNFVRIKGEDGLYSLLMHLKHGSVTVKKGQEVKRGDKIGECGNSGNSREPHLHFHVSFGEDKHWVTLPSEFENYRVLLSTSSHLKGENSPPITSPLRGEGGSEGWLKLKRGIPKKGEIIRQ